MFFQALYIYIGKPDLNLAAPMIASIKIQDLIYEHRPHLVLTKLHSAKC